MKKYIISTAILIQTFLILLCAGIFCMTSDGGQVAYAATVGDVLIAEEGAPAGLEELREASDEQLDYWAENLTSFDGRNYGYITTAKNQYDKNICWAFSAVGAAEASILREGINPNATKDNLDLDEYVAAYMRFNRDGSRDPLMLTSNDTFSGNWNQGSNSHVAFAVMTQGYALANQETSYYPSEENIKNAVAASDYFVQNYIRVPKSASDIKRAVMRYGAVTIEYKSPGGYYNYLYHANGESTNHASIIVGWDDNVDRSYFAPNKPNENGAWIVKNSWGEHGTQKDGVYCYYLSYESYIGANIYAVDLAMKKDYQNLYYYDGQLATSARNYLAEAQAAIYEAKLSGAARQEQLKAVSLECAQNDLDVNIKIYRHLNVNPGNVNDERNNPVQGAIAAEKTVKIARQGWYTIDLDEPLELEQGEYFSIVVSCKNPYDQYVPIPCSADGGGSVNDMTYRMYNGVWESYKKSNFYADTSSDNMAVRIRAVTNTVQRAETLGNDLKYARVEIPERLLYYSRGRELIPDMSVYFDDVLLSEKRDYNVRIQNSDAPGMATVKITGAGGYYGTRTTAFEIAKLKYPPGNLSGTVDVYNDTTRLHEIPIPNDWEWINEDYVLEYGSTYFPVSLKYVGDDKDFYQITTCDFYVNKINADPPDKTDISGASVEISGRYVYIGRQIVPTVSVIYMEQQLREGMDYNLSCRNNVNAGQAEVTVTGAGKYEGVIVRTFEIVKAELPKESPDDVIAISRKAVSLGDVLLGCKDWFWKEPGLTVSGESFVATAVYKGADRDNYECVEKQITVIREEKRDIADITELRLERTSFVYDGKDKTPNAVARDGNMVLVAGTDFEITYMNNKNAGSEAVATITGINDYCGTATLIFTIEKADRNSFSVSQTGWTFGDTASPSPQISGEEETGDITYLYSSEANGSFTADKPINAGKYWIKALIGESLNYRAAECMAAFEIAPKNLVGLTAVVDDGDAVYSGLEIEPEVSVLDGQSALTANIDFTVVYENNISAGTSARAIIRGKNNYTGMITATFEIKKANAGSIETVIRTDKKFKELSDVELPEDFEWEEGSLTKVSENVYKATAVYTGGNYDVEKLEFEIIIEEQTGQDGGNAGNLIWLVAVPVVAAVAAAGCAIAVHYLRKRRK